MLPQSSVCNCGAWRWRGASMDVRGMGGVGGGLRIPGGGLRMSLTQKVLSSARKVLKSCPGGRVTHGAPAAPAPRLGSLGSPCTCTMVHLGSSAPNCTVHLGASELMRTRIKVLIRPLAPNRTVHLGTSERLTVLCCAAGERLHERTHRSLLSKPSVCNCHTRKSCPVELGF